jgi:hypothetical protein
MRKALLAIPLFLLTACGPPWSVVRQSGPPSALAGQNVIGVGFDWSAATVDSVPEQAHLANLPPNEQADWMDARNVFMSTYLAELQLQLAQNAQVMPTTGAEPVQLVVRPLAIQRGYYRVFVAQDTRAELDLVFAVGGQPTDEILTRTSVNASLGNPTVRQRLADCGTRLARITAMFFRRAQAGGQ